MNDSAQDLEQLIHQYTQELLRFQKQYAAHMPDAPDAPEPEQPAVVPTASPVQQSVPETEPEGETDNSGDRPLLLANDDGRFPRAPMADGLNAPAPSEPELPEEPSDELPEETGMENNVAPAEPQPPEMPLDNRDLMSDPDAATPQAFPPETVPQPSTPEQTDFGRLQVQVFKANEAIPIENATVSIMQEEPDGTLIPFTVTRTNSSGFTPTITVPTVSATLSLEPGHEHPYSTYAVHVITPGYFTVEDIHVPVYGGVTSVQPVELLPLPENYQGDTTITYPESEPNL